MVSICGLRLSPLCISVHGFSSYRKRLIAEIRLRKIGLS
jgi:hypothetical protein